MSKAIVLLKFFVKRLCFHAFMIEMIAIKLISQVIYDLLFDLQNHISCRTPGEQPIRTVQ